MTRSESPRAVQRPPLAVTYREAAQTLGVCERTMVGLVKDEKLPAIRIGRSVRIPVKALETFVEQQSSQA